METINIPKEEYEELLRKSKELTELQNQKNPQKENPQKGSEEVNEDDFNNLEVKQEYLEKLERIEKEGYGETFSSIEELRERIKSQNAS